MKKGIKYVNIFILILFIIVYIICFFTGKKIERDLPILQSNFIEACHQVADKDNPTFDSKWCDLKLTQQKRNLFYTDLNFITQDKNIVARIYHGPFSWGAIKHGIWLPQMATVVLNSSDLAINGFISLSYSHHVIFGFHLLPFKQFYSIESASKKWSLENEQTEINGNFNLKLLNKIHLSVQSIHFQINKNPITTNITLDYKKYFNKEQCDKQLDEIEEINLSLLQNSDYGNLLFTFDLSTFSLTKLYDFLISSVNFDKINKNGLNTLTKLNELIDYSKLSIQSNAMNLAYLHDIFVGEEDLNYANIVLTKKELDRSYEKMPFQYKLVLDKIDDEYKIHFILNSKKKLIVLNDVDLPFRQSTKQ